MAGSRARLVRAFAAAPQQRYGVAFEAVYQGGPIWDLSWTDGPSSATVRALAAAADLGGAQLGSYRRYSTMATAPSATAPDRRPPSNRNWPTPTCPTGPTTLRESDDGR